MASQIPPGAPFLLFSSSLWSIDSKLAEFISEWLPIVAGVVKGEYEIVT